MRRDGRENWWRLPLNQVPGGHASGRHTDQLTVTTIGARAAITPGLDQAAPGPERPAPDWARTETLASNTRASVAGASGNEAELVLLFLEQEAAGHHDQEACIVPSDTIVREMPFRFGHADLVMFHVDGSVTVIEARDGSRGYDHVVAGIGRAGLYAVQLAASKGAVKRVRRALLWSSTDDFAADGAIGAACAVAGEIPMAWPSMRVLMANVAAVRGVMEAGS